jgi:hypothetical protein
MLKAALAVIRFRSMADRLCVKLNPGKATLVGKIDRLSGALSDVAWIDWPPLAHRRSVRPRRPPAGRTPVDRWTRLRHGSVPSAGTGRGGFECRFQ